MSGRHAMGLGNLLLPEISTTASRSCRATCCSKMRPIPLLARPRHRRRNPPVLERDLLGPLDYLLVDMPPGTADVALTVFQSLPVDGIVIVTSPQDLVSMIVAKAVNMAEKMNIPVLGIVENMAYVECPDCGKEDRGIRSQ